MTMQYLGLGIYYLFLALSGGYFFAVIPTLILYLVANFKPSEPVKVNEISYQDVLYFKSKAELLDFLKTGKVKERKNTPKGNLIALFLVGLFFILVFAYAYKSFIPFLSVAGIILMRNLWKSKGGRGHEKTTA